jgi:beta-aspartyl-peptidase (threonine type)
MPQRPSLIVHGGAWDIPAEAAEDCRAGCRRALEAGWKILSQDGSALDAVEAAVVVLEEDPTFDAGIGSHLNRDGRAQLDAILMDGRTLKAGAVAAVERVRNPIRLARRVLEESEHILLVGAGAELFAAEQGFPLCAPEELVIERERRAWEQFHAHGKSASPCLPGAGHEHPSFGTVGAVARDARGNLAGGTSTGGTCCKFPGRVGDSPLIGCGCYADDEAGAVSATGAGEAIMRVVLAKAATDLLRAGSPAQQAAQACVELLAQRTGGKGGLILLDRAGNPGFAFNTSAMAYGFVTADGSFVTEV